MSTTRQLHALTTLTDILPRVAERRRIYDRRRNEITDSDNEHGGCMGRLQSSQLGDMHSLLIARNLIQRIREYNTFGSVTSVRKDHLEQ